MTNGSNTLPVDGREAGASGDIGRNAARRPGRRALLLGALLALGTGFAPESHARAGGHAHKPRTAEKPAAVQPPAAPPKPARTERVPFTAAETAGARPAGLPGTLRIAGDDADAFRALIEAAPAAGDPWLVLSGGGENGAFAAGLLAGWTQAGDRPSFGVVTGVSTGALIAPFAFVGPAADPMLKKNYTEISAADVFEFGGTEAALTDTWPLKERIDTSVTPDLMRAVAAEHAKGRRLLVATTQVDTERPVLWDMGAIATLAAGPAGGEGGKQAEAAIGLFRAVMLASTAVPGVFPPVMLDAVTEQGKGIQEMHDDGGAMTPFFLAPASALEGGAALTLPTRRVYLVVNNRLTPEFGLVPRTVLGVLGGTVSAAIKAQTSAALALTRLYAAKSGLDLRVAEIDRRFTKRSPGPFDGGYMRALFAHGEAIGRAGSAFAEPAGAGGPEAACMPAQKREGALAAPASNGNLAGR